MQSKTFEPKSRYARFWLVGSGKPTAAALRTTAVGLGAISMV